MGALLVVVVAAIDTAKLRLVSKAGLLDPGVPVKPIALAVVLSARKLKEALPGIVGVTQMVAKVPIWV